MLQPITYSLIINVLALVGSGILAYVFATPLLFLLAILLATHAIQRFERGSDDDDDDPPTGGAPVSEYSETRAGFVRS